MGDWLTEGQNPPTSQTPYGDTFDAMLPHYMAIGMTYDQFWDGEYGIRKAFREANRIRIENEQRIADVNNWYLGQYMRTALQSVQLIAIAGVVGGKKMPEPGKYPEKPFLQQADEEKKEEVKKQHEEDQSKIAMAMFQAMIGKFNKNIEKRLEREKAEGTGQ